MAENAGSASPQGPRRPAFRDARAENPGAASSWRSLAVEACAGTKIASWPLGRFDVGAEGLRVRLGFSWFVTRSAGKDAIRVVPGVWCVRFEDSGQRLADVHGFVIKVEPDRSRRWSPRRSTGCPMIAVG
jgi:hypothetical protein